MKLSPMSLNRVSAFSGKINAVQRQVSQTLFPPHSCQVVYVEGGCFSSTTTGISRLVFFW